MREIELRMWSELKYLMQREKWLGSIWFWWATITSAYGLSILLFGAKWVSYIVPATIGLFVPFGMLSMILFISFWGWLNVTVFAGLMFGAEYVINKIKVTLFQKILVIFVALFLLTSIMDLIHFTPFVSIRWLLTGTVNELRFDP